MWGVKRDAHLFLVPQRAVSLLSLRTQIWGKHESSMAIRHTFLLPTIPHLNFDGIQTYNYYLQPPTLASNGRQMSNEDTRLPNFSPYPQHSAAYKHVTAAYGAAYLLNTFEL